MKKLLVGSFILFLSANVFAGEVSQYAGPYAGLHFGYSQGDSKGYETDTGVANGTTADKGSLSKYIFGGRLGDYKYYDMHQVIASALYKSKSELEKI